jgi:MFS transporter, ACS family, L-galactonate transporter
MTESTGSRTLRRHQTVTLSLLFVAGVVNFLDRSSLSIANTTVRAEMHLSATQMGWLLSAFSLAYGIAQLPLIGLLDRAGTRKVLGGGLILWSTAQMLTGLVRTFPMFVALRVLLGAGEAPFYPSGIRSTREWFTSATRARATAIMSSSQPIGLSIAPPILTGIMLALGWRAMFIVLGVAGLLVAAAWLAFHHARHETDLADPPQIVILSEAASLGEGAQSKDLRHPDLPTEPRPFPPPTSENTASALRALIRQRTVWGMMIGWGGINYTVWLYLAWLPAFLQDQRHLSLARTGLIAALPNIAGAFGMLSSGFLSDRLHRHGLRLTTIHRVNLVAGMIASAAGTFFVAHSHTTAQAVAGISLAIFCIHFAGTSGLGYVQTVSPLRYVGSLMALQNFFSFMIASAAPVLTGWLLDRTQSFNLALGVCSAVALLGALSYATLAAPSGIHLEENAHQRTS